MAERYNGDLFIGVQSEAFRRASQRSLAWRPVLEQWVQPAVFLKLLRKARHDLYMVVFLRFDSAPPGGRGYGRHGLIGPWPGDDHNDVLDAEGSNFRTPAGERVGGLPRLQPRAQGLLDVVVRPSYLLA